MSMRVLVPCIAAAFLLGLSPTSEAAPKKGSKGSTTKEQPAPKPTPTPTPKPEGQRLDTSGVVTSIMVDKSGDILSMSVRVSGSTRTQHVKGCGAKIAEQPLLQWAFLEGRLVYLTIAADECLMNATYSAP